MTSRRPRRPSIRPSPRFPPIRSSRTSPASSPPGAANRGAAEDHFEAAIRLQPRAPAAYVNLGRLLQDARRHGSDGAARPRWPIYARLLAIDRAPAGGAVPDGAARGARRPLRGGAAGARSPARGGARATTRARGAGRRPGRQRRRGRRPAHGRRAGRPSTAGCARTSSPCCRRSPACTGARHRAGPARAARSARLGDAGDAAPSRRHRDRRRPPRRGAGLAREGGGAGRPRRRAADRPGARRVQGRRSEGLARLPGARARSRADQRRRCTSCSASSASS